MSTMIERVAGVICTGGSYAPVCKPICEACTRCARAAIKAMREPPADWDIHLRCDWPTMIDAILEEENAP